MILADCKDITFVYQIYKLGPLLESRHPIVITLSVRPQIDFGDKSFKVNVTGEGSLCHPTNSFLGDNFSLDRSIVYKFHTCMKEDPY